MTDFKWILKAFGDRLRLLLQERGISQAELARRLDYSDAQIGNWIHGRNDPGVINLVRLTKVLQSSPNALLGQADSSAETQFSESVQFIMPNVIKENEYKAMRAEFLSSVKNVLWIQARVGSDWYNYNADLQGLLTRSSLSLRLLLPSPDYGAAMDVLSKSRANSGHGFHTKTDVAKTESTFSGLVNENIVFHYKYTEYLPSNVIYFADPCSEQGKLFMIPSSFQVDYWQAPIIIMRRQSNESVFDYFVKQFIRMWGDDSDEKFNCFQD